MGLKTRLILYQRPSLGFVKNVNRVVNPRIYAIELHRYYSDKVPANEYQNVSASDILRKSNAANIIRRGSGGRSSVSGHVATVFGCTGFLGHYLVNCLGGSGTQVITPYRRVESSRMYLKPMGDLGQIVPMVWDLYDPMRTLEAVRHSDTVYNLAGRDNETRNFSFNRIHVDGARLIAKTCKEAGVRRFVHVSCLNADPNSSSAYLRSKGLGEIAVKEEFPEAIIVRPGKMYGNGDRFISKIAATNNFLMKTLLFDRIPVTNATLYPTYVGDVARALTKIMDTEDIEGRVFELAGTPIKYAEMVELFCEVARRPHLPMYASQRTLRMLSKISYLIRDAGFSESDVERMFISEKLSDNALQFQHLGIHPQQLQALAVDFMKIYRPAQAAREPLESPQLKRLKILQKIQKREAERNKQPEVLVERYI